jgi:hypothetical protein
MSYIITKFKDGSRTLTRTQENKYPAPAQNKRGKSKGFSPEAFAHDISMRYGGYTSVEYHE